MATPRLLREIADALVQAAHETGQVSRVIEDIEVVMNAFHTHPDLLVALQERSTPQPERAKALRGALEKQIDPFVINALLTLQDADLLADLPIFFSLVVGTAQERAQHYEIRIQSALPLTPEELAQLDTIMKKKFGGTHRISASVDPNLIGGLTLTVADQHIDASLKGKIERLKLALITP